MRAPCLESVSSERHNGLSFRDGKEAMEVAARQNRHDVYYSKGCNNQSFDNKIYMQHDGTDSSLGHNVYSKQQRESTIRDSCSDLGENEFAEMEYMNFTVISSNKPYGISDGSNPFFDSHVIAKFHLQRDGVHSGHVQTGMCDPFCLVHNGKGRCEVFDHRSVKAIQRKTTGIGQMRYLRNVPRRFKSSFREGNLSYLTGNLLSGPVPDWILQNGENINLFESSSTDWYSFHIICGGKEVTLDGNMKYEADTDSGGPSRFFLSGTNWAFSSTGYFLDTSSSDFFICTNISRLSMKDSDLYVDARLSPISLTYYGFCLLNGSYTDGYTKEVTSPEAVLVLVATKAKQDSNVDSLLNNFFIEASWRKMGKYLLLEIYSCLVLYSVQLVINLPEQTGRFDIATQFPYVSTRFLNKETGKAYFLALLYLLKLPVELTDLKGNYSVISEYRHVGILVTSIGWANTATINIVYVLQMMGRDDIPVGLGDVLAIGQADPSFTLIGDCKYRQAIPRCSGGFLDSDTLWFCSLLAS
ncbi:hypothetical protein HYC85_016413 [Camellia sinensis]|uniref:Malectin domain-containing protein n=1 Tax=Camellia sinensis TaxID=4442 RepID=A0A7J7H109_CAMSI|nr:hypothetical protein HYC85_016413 [Camellia sinensis]